VHGNMSSIQNIDSRFKFNVSAFDDELTVHLRIERYYFQTNFKLVVIFAEENKCFFLFYFFSFLLFKSSSTGSF